VNRLLAISFVLAACSKQSDSNEPIDVRGDGWSCYSYLGEQTHCELRFDFCEQTRAAISPNYKAEACRRVDVVWCFVRPGDEPVTSTEGDPPMVEELIRRWCYRSPEECALHDPSCEMLP